MKWFLITAWVLGFLMTDFHGCSRFEAITKRALWPLTACQGARAWWQGKAKMYLFLDTTRRR